MFTHTYFQGTKNKWLIAFYGYGQSADVYHSLHDRLSKEWNIIVIDNPMQDYHQALKPLDLKLYLEALQVNFGFKNFSSISYSMGSRLHLFLPLFFAQQMDQMILMAPDGIKTNFWNRLAVRTFFGKRLFKYFVENGQAYFFILNFLHRIGIINKALFAFSKRHMRDEKRRRGVYNAWMNLQYFQPKLREINAVCKEKNIHLISYFGQRDKVIKPEVYNYCQKKLTVGTHHLINQDHQMLHKEMFTLLVKIL